MLKLIKVTVAEKKCLKSRISKEKKSRGRMICFSCTWNEKVKKHRDTLKSAIRNCLLFGTLYSKYRDGMQLVSVITVAIWI
jgi:hypothetical protein